MKRVVIIPAACAAIWAAAGLVPTALGQEAPEETKAEGTVAAAPGQEEDVGALGEVVVSASRSEQREQEVGRSVDVVPRREIEQRLAQTVPDVLDESAGVAMQKTNAGAGAPIIRGFIGPQNVILIDGVRFNNSTFRTGPNQYLALIDPWSLERVEVLRGPGSVLYGSDALGGVIHLETLAPRKLEDRMFGGSVRGGFGSAWMEGSGGTQVDFSSAPANAYLGGTYALRQDLRAGGGDKQPLSGFGDWHGRAKSVQDLGGGWSTTEVVLINAITDAGRTDTAGIGKLSTADNTDLLAYARVQRAGAGLFKGLTLNLSYHEMHETGYGYRCPTGDDGSVKDLDGCLGLGLDVVNKRDKAEDVVRTPGFFATWEARFLDNRVRAMLGGEGYFDFVSSSKKEAKVDDGWTWKEKDRGNYSDDSKYTMLGAFLNVDGDVVKIDSSRVNLSGGVRFSYASAEAPDVPGVGDVTYDFSGVVGAAGLKFLQADWLNVYADFSQGFRAPNLQETTVLGNTGSTFEVPNDTLTPESANTVEVGTKVRTDWLKVSAAGFGTWVSDVFARETVPEAEWKALGISADDVGELEVKRRVNADSAFYRGAEGFLAVGPFEGISVWANAAWIKADLDPKSGESVPARRIPPLMGAGGVKYQSDTPSFYAELYVKWAAAQDRLGPEDEKDLRICEDPAHPGQLLEDCKGSESWMTLNLRGGYEPFDFLRVGATLENLLDTEYKYFGSGISAPGFNALLDLTATY